MLVDTFSLEFDYSTAGDHSGQDTSLSKRAVPIFTEWDTRGVRLGSRWFTTIMDATGMAKETTLEEKLHKLNQIEDVTCI